MNPLNSYVLDRESIKLDAYRLLCLFYANKEISRQSDPTGESPDAAVRLEQSFFAREMTRLLPDRPVHHLLDVLARVNAETPIAKLRWSIAHLNDASPETLKRLQTVGMGWLVQNAFYFRGEGFLGQRGADAARLVPPLASALRLNLPVGGGTDAHRVMAPNPFVSLQWMLDGKTISGVAMRAPEELPTRIDALRLYTEGSAWFSFEENARGALAVGQLADLAVLSRDYLSVPVEQIGSTVSLLTMVGGRIVYADGPFAALEETPR